MESRGDDDGHHCWRWSCRDSDDFHLKLENDARYDPPLSLSLFLSLSLYIYRKNMECK